MAQSSRERPTEPGADRSRSSHLAQGLLIAAIVLLIVIAVISFN